MIKLATEPEQPDFTLLLSGKKGKTEPKTIFPELIELG